MSVSQSRTAASPVTAHPTWSPLGRRNLRTGANYATNGPRGASEALSPQTRVEWCDPCERRRLIYRQIGFAAKGQVGGAFLIDECPVVNELVTEAE